MKRASSACLSADGFARDFDIDRDESRLETFLVDGETEVDFLGGGSDRRE